MTYTSKIFELQNPKDLKVIQEIITLNHPNEIVAETIYTAISPGTEVAAWLGKPPLRPSKIYPRVVGYCNIARVIEVGLDIKHIKIGDVILTGQSHRSSFTINASEVLVCFSDIDDAEARKLCVTYLFHIGYSALTKAEYFPGNSIAVIGLGALGYCTAKLVTVLGGSPHIFTNQKNRENLFDGGTTKLSHKNNKDKEIDNQNQFDLVISTTDEWEDYILGLKLLNNYGKYILLGFPGRGKKLPEFNPLDSQFMYCKQLSICYAGLQQKSNLSSSKLRFSITQNMSYLSELILKGRLKVDQLIDSTRSWEDLPNIYESLNTRENNSLTVVLKWH